MRTLSLLALDHSLSLCRAHREALEDALGDMKTIESPDLDTAGDRPSG